MDSNMGGIAGANVAELIWEVPTGKSVRTDEDGYFQIDVLTADSDLRFTHAGYDYDTMRAGDFYSYIQLYSPTLDEVHVDGTKSASFPWLLVIGTAVAGLAIGAIANSSKPEPRKVKV